MAFSIGNTAINNTLIASTGVVTISLSAGSDILIQIGTTALSSAGAPVTVTNVTSANLTFALRSAQTRHDVDIGAGATWQDAEVWWAYSSGALTSEVITVHLSGSPDTGTVNAYECQGVTNPSSPWDINIALPAKATNDNTNPTVTGVSTTATAPVGLCFVFDSNAISVPAFSPGTWTSAHTLNQDLGSNTQNRTGMSWQQFASAQSSASWVAQNSTSRNWIVIGDAFGPADISLVPPAAALSLTANAPIINNAVSILVPARSLILSSAAPTVAVRVNTHILVPAGSLTLSSDAVTVNDTIDVNQLVPAPTQFVAFLSNLLDLVASQLVPAPSQIATLLGSASLSANQQVPAPSQTSTFITHGATIASLPDNIMRGARGGPTFSTSKLIGFSGLEQRVINFEQSVNAYTLGYGLSKATWLDVLALHYAQLGGANGFAAKDWSDYQISNQSIGTGDGTTTDFQLIKKYATSVRSYTRIITQPRLNTLIVSVGGTPTAAYSLQPNGIVRFNSPPAGSAALTASCDFDILVAFDQQSDHLDIQMQLIDTGQIPTINLKEIPPTATGLPILHVISAPSGNVDSTALPENVERAARGGSTFSTTRLISTSGKPFLSANFPQSVNSYTIGYTCDDATWPTVLAMFYAQHGSAYGFTFRDWSDYKVTAQQIGIGDGTTTDFQLVRLYDDGPRRYGRYITLPDAITSVMLNGTPTSAYTLQANGLIRFNSAPASGSVISASFSFFIPVRFHDDHLDVTIQPGMAAPATMGQIVTINLIEILAGSP